MNNNIINLLNELQLYHNNKNNILQIAIQERLDKSLNTYTNELNLTTDYLLRQNEVKTLRTIHRLEKRNSND